mmetsp:Transcript_25414/g.64529  ORF Transcript_25414/g.64529 Transcript_25414/m.64529 type:complete len:233 (+) Transcript_25414:545-1243(+)
MMVMTGWHSLRSLTEVLKSMRMVLRSQGKGISCQTSFFWIIRGPTWICPGFMSLLRSPVHPPGRGPMFLHTHERVTGVTPMYSLAWLMTLKLKAHTRSASMGSLVVKRSLPSAVQSPVALKHSGRPPAAVSAVMLSSIEAVRVRPSITMVWLALKGTLARSVTASVFSPQGVGLLLCIVLLIHVGSTTSMGLERPPMGSSYLMDRGSWLFMYIISVWGMATLVEGLVLVDSM